MPPLETLPLPGDPSGGVFYLRIVLSPEEASRPWVFQNNFVFHGEELLAPRPTPKLEDHLLSAVHDCLFNIFAAALHIGGRSSIRNLRTRHAVVPGTHKHGRGKQTQVNKLKKQINHVKNLNAVAFQLWSLRNNMQLVWPVVANFGTRRKESDWVLTGLHILGLSQRLLISRWSSFVIVRRVTEEGSDVSEKRTTAIFRFKTVALKTDARRLSESPECSSIARRSDPKKDHQLAGLI